MVGTNRLGSLALAVTLGITMVACGGDDKESTGDIGANGDVSVDGDGDLSGLGKDCAELVSVFAGAYASIGAAMGGSTGDDLEQAAEVFDKAAGKLPKEIRADFEIFADAYTKFAKAMVEADIDFSDPESMDSNKLADLQTLSAAFDDPKVQAASQKVEAYLEAECGTG